MLTAATRAAHEAAQEIKDLIREAITLRATLITEFERIHRTEIKELSNHLTSEANRQASQLNTEVRAARQAILEHLSTLKPHLDTENGLIVLEMPDALFNDQQPMPYPPRTTKEHHS